MKNSTKVKKAADAAALPENRGERRLSLGRRRRSVADLSLDMWMASRGRRGFLRFAWPRRAGEK